jgi:Ca2+/Na+ antiporter
MSSLAISFESSLGAVMSVVLLLALLLLVFWILAKVCDEAIAPTLEELSLKLNVPKDVACATFLALGSSAPEIVISSASTALHANDTNGAQDVSNGTMFGSACIAFTLIPGLCVLVSPSGFMKLEFIPLVRDASFYVIGILVFVFAASTSGNVDLIETIGLIFIFFFYLLSMRFLLRFYNKHEGTHHFVIPVEEEQDIQIKNNENVTETNIEKATTTTTSENDVEKQQQQQQNSNNHNKTIESSSKISPSTTDPGIITTTTTTTAEPNSTYLKQQESKPTNDDNNDDDDVDSLGSETELPISIASINDKGDISIQESQIVEFKQVHNNTNNNEDDEPPSFLSRILSKILPPFGYTEEEDMKAHWKLILLTSVVYVSFLAEACLQLTLALGYIARIPDHTLGVILIALGAQIPDTFASLAIAKQGEGPGAVSNAIGSQVLNITLGLGLPFFFSNLISGRPIRVDLSEAVPSGISLVITVTIFLVLACRRKFLRWTDVTSPLAGECGLSKKDAIILLLVYLCGVLVEIATSTSLPPASLLRIRRRLIYYHN